eukprot:762574-Hanusia_phi.AAC.2
MTYLTYICLITASAAAYDPPLRPGGRAHSDRAASGGSTTMIALILLFSRVSSSWRALTSDRNPQLVPSPPAAARHVTPGPTDTGRLRQARTGAQCLGHTRGQ